MTISTSDFLVLLTTALLLWTGLLWRYWAKWEDTITAVGHEIRQYNARNGYDARVNKDDLARDFLVPTRNQHIRELVDKYDTTPNQYLSDLRGSVERPSIFWRMVFHLLGFLYTLSGVSFVFPGGFLSGEFFLGTVVLWYLVSLAMFLSLK